MVFSIIYAFGFGIYFFLRVLSTTEFFRCTQSMAKPLKKASNKIINLGEDLKSQFNSDEWHKLFNILNEYEEAGGSANDKFGRLIQKYIEKNFAKHSLPLKSEAEFILKKMNALVFSWIVKGKPMAAKNNAKKKDFVNAKGLLSEQDIKDTVSEAFTKLLVSGSYDLTAPEAQKFSYIYQVTYSATIDRLRNLKNFKIQLEPDPEVLTKRKSA